MTLPATFVIDTPGDAARAAELRRVKLLATLVLAATFAIFLGGEGVAAGASGVRLHRGLCRSRHHRRPRRLVRRGGLVSQASGAADPAHRDHPEQPAPHRRQARRIHRGAFPRSRARRSQAAADRFRLVHRRLAARPQAQRGSRALCAAAVAGSGRGDGEFRADDLRQPPHHRAIDVDRSGAARRRHAARLREGRPASGPARRSSCAAVHADADAGRDHGDDPRKDPRRIADAAETLSRRQVSGEQDRGVGHRLLRGSPQRSRASVPRRVRSHGADRSSTASAPIRPMPSASRA